MAHLGGYLGHDLTTPLGGQLDMSRQRAALTRGSKKESRGKASPAPSVALLAIAVLGAALRRRRAA